VKRQHCLFWLLTTLGHLIGAQSSANAQSVKTFEVASVKPYGAGAQAAQSWKVTGNRVELLGIPVRILIARAFEIPMEQLDRLVGVPDWAIRDLFEIRAVIPDGASERDVPGMLKALLADRFGLKARIEPRPYGVYELIASPSGPTFPEVGAIDDLHKDFTGDPGKSASDTMSQLPDGGGFRTITRFEPDGRLRFITVTEKTRYSYKVLEGNVRELDAERITMQEFSSLLRVDRPVVDKTGLTGIYRFKTLLPPITISARLQATLGDRVRNESFSLSRAVEPLGLKLEPKNTPVDFIVIDRIERPTPN
jgi:uncharacterized protein (TIGR03435 family)